MVIAPANTGSESKSKIAVIKTDHTNNGIRSKSIVIGRIFRIVVIKLIAPKIEETPAKCNEKIVRSIVVDGWYSWFERGG